MYKIFHNNVFYTLVLLCLNFLKKILKVRTRNMGYHINYH